MKTPTFPTNTMMHWGLKLGELQRSAKNDAEREAFSHAVVGLVAGMTYCRCHAWENYSNFCHELFHTMQGMEEEFADQPYEAGPAHKPKPKPKKKVK